MLILEDLSIEVPDTNAHHWNLKEYSEESDDSVLVYGYNGTANREYHERCHDFKRKVYFNNWAPCEFAQHKPHNNKTGLEYDEYFNEIYSICPYTSEWLNSLDLGRQYKSVFYPFNSRIIPDPVQKKYDVIYHGGIHGQEHLDCLQVMSNFNYRYVTMINHINRMTQRCLSYATNTNLPFREKINLVAQSKISVCYNLVHMEPQHVSAIKTYTDWQKNEAFSEVDNWNVMPQFKTRAHEAAISRTLNLVQYDKWNIMEKYYEPGKEFVYFSDKGDLESKISEILNNWDSYQQVVENAYNKAMNYTTSEFVQLVKSGEGW